MARKQKHQRDGVYQRDDRKGFWGSYVDATGRRRQRKLKNVSTLQQAQTALVRIKDKVQYEIDHGIAPPSEERFEEFAKDFLNYQRRRISPTVVRGKISQKEFTRQEGIVEGHLIPYFGQMKLSTIRKKDVAGYIDSRTGAVSDGSIIKEVNVLKRMFNLAVEREKIATNPVKGVKLPKAPEGRVRWLSAEELSNVLRACPEWLRPIVGLLVSTGMRRGELMKIRWEDVALERCEMRLRFTKSGKERIAFINGLTLQVLTFLRSEHGKPRGLLFPDVTPAQVSVAFARAVKKAEVENFTLHDLRHHYASMLRQNGVDLHTLQKLLGHSDPRMTDRYAHLSQSFLLDAAKKLEGVVSLEPALAIQETIKRNEQV